MNKNIFPLVKIEFINTFRPVLIKTAFVVSVIYVLFWLKAGPASFEVKDYLSQYFSVIRFAIILASVFILGREFKNGTYKYTFTGCFSRMSILFSKIIAIAGLGFICWLLQVLIKIIIVLWTGKGTLYNDIFNYELFSTLIIYVAVAALIGSFSILVTSISFSLKATMIYTLLLFGIIQFYAPIFIIGIEKAENIPFWFELIKISPTYIIFDWNDTFKFQIIQLIFMLIYIILFLGFSILILKKKDLNK
ncbi:ABC-2 family transporter [Anaerobacterium chartisolvens]|uniref:ABC-2 family transporter n=1 Tax=Anaerobacterium chartisolvens TaxID=1297424 RepID=A0A369BG66_9FIRM|nr:ABC transporter permease subunit [Anaerobacterium chartisolvens]RCX19467.1 ABC-2 family transporter [Anaerobacterium chartisolvens]